VQQDADPVLATEERHLGLEGLLRQELQDGVLSEGEPIVARLEHGVFPREPHAEQPALPPGHFSGRHLDALRYRLPL